MTGQARALYDSGSQINLITTDCIQRLGLHFQSADIYVAGVGGQEAIRAKGYLDVDVIGHSTFHSVGASSPSGCIEYKISNADI